MRAVRSEVKRVAYGALAVFAALLLIAGEGPPLWVVWAVLFLVGLNGYHHHNESTKETQ